jgi:hypothetical protein
LARYEDAKSAPKRTYKHAKISNFAGGHIPLTPESKREGREGRGWVGVGREGTGVWPTQKLSRGAPYACADAIKIQYYSAELGRKDICCYCCNDNVVRDENLLKKFKTVLQLCKTCVDDGCEAISERPYAK